MKIVEKAMREGGQKILVCTEEIMFCDIEVSRFNDTQLRELIVHLKKNRPELICPIMCEDCAEHLAQESYSNYCINKSERGK